MTIEVKMEGCRCDTLTVLFIFSLVSFTYNPFFICPLHAECLLLDILTSVNVTEV